MKLLRYVTITLCNLTLCSCTYMEHGGRLPANCALTLYYLPVYPPYSDYNYGLSCSSSLLNLHRTVLLKNRVADAQDFFTDLYLDFTDLDPTHLPAIVNKDSFNTKFPTFHTKANQFYWQLLRLCELYIWWCSEE